MVSQNEIRRYLIFQQRRKRRGMPAIRRSATTTSDDEPLRKRRRSTRVARAKQSGRKPRYTAVSFLDLEAKAVGDTNDDDEEFEEALQEDYEEDYVPSDDESSIAVVSTTMENKNHSEGSYSTLLDTSNEEHPPLGPASSDIASKGPPSQSLSDIAVHLQKLASSLLSHPHIDPQELAELRIRSVSLENELRHSRQESNAILHKLQTEHDQLEMENEGLKVKSRAYEAAEQHWKSSEVASSSKINQLAADKDELIKQKTKLEEGNKHLLAALNAYHGSSSA